MDLGSKIASLRKENNTSQGELAKHLNVTRQAVSNWERNKSEPDAEMIRDIAEYFDVKIDALFYDEVQGGNSRKKFAGLLKANLVLLAVHIAAIIFKKTYFIPVMILPMLIVFILLIIHLVFSSSIKNNDYSIIAGYDKGKDDVKQLKKQLHYIEMLVQFIGLMCNVLFFFTYFLDKERIMPVTLIITGVFIIGIAASVLTANKKVQFR